MSVRIRRSISQDTTDILRLTDAEFGAGYFVRRYQNTLHSDLNIDTFVAEHSEDGIVGFISVIAVDDARLFEEFRISSEIGGLSGLLKIAAVDKSHQRQGIGTSLMNEAVDSLTRRGVISLWGSAWINPSTGMASEKMLDNAGLKQVRIVENFWTAESLEFPEWPCSECSVPCKCSAMIYYGSIQHTEGVMK